MISLLILASGENSIGVPPERVARSLATIVPLAVDGLVRDVVLAGLDGSPESRDLAVIADHAGCSLVIGAGEGEILATGLAGLRDDVVLVLRAGLSLGQGFAGDLANLSRAVASGSRRGALLRVDARRFGHLNPFATRNVGIMGRRSAFLAAQASSLNQLIRLTRANARFERGAIRLT